MGRSGFNVVYRKKNFRIYDVGEEFVIHNTKYDFESHHTHINNFKTCKYIIDLCLYKTVPYHLSDYLLISILRLSDDEQYKSKIRKVLEDNKRKRYYKYNPYINSNKSKDQKYKNKKKGKKNGKRTNFSSEYKK